MSIITTTSDGSYMNNTRLKMIRVIGKLHDGDIDEYEEKAREFNINVNAIQGYSLKKQKSGSYIEIFLLSSSIDRIQCSVKQNPGLLDYLNGSIEYIFSEIEAKIEPDIDDENKNKVLTDVDLFEFIKRDDSDSPGFLNDNSNKTNIWSGPNYYSYPPSNDSTDFITCRDSY